MLGAGQARLARIRREADGTVSLRALARPGQRVRTKPLEESNSPGDAAESVVGEVDRSAGEEPIRSRFLGYLPTAKPRTRQIVLRSVGMTLTFRHREVRLTCPACLLTVFDADWLASILRKFLELHFGGRAGAVAVKEDGGRFSFSARRAEEGTEQSVEVRMRRGLLVLPALDVLLDRRAARALAYALEKAPENSRDLWQGLDDVIFDTRSPTGFGSTETAAE
jgi:hypothetical protein